MIKIKYTFIKTVSYACMHVTLSVLTAYFLTGSWAIACAIGMIEPFVQTVGFFFHERAWHKIEDKLGDKCYSDDVIDSVSPCNNLIEKILRHKH